MQGRGQCLSSSLQDGSSSVGYPLGRHSGRGFESLFGIFELQQTSEKSNGEQESRQEPLAKPTKCPEIWRRWSRGDETVDRESGDAEAISVHWSRRLSSLHGEQIIDFSSDTMESCMGVSDEREECNVLQNSQIKHLLLQPCPSE